MAYFLNVCVVGRLNILVSGGTGTGKTTLLNVLSSFIPKGERIVTIEDTPELSINHFNSVRMQTKPQTPTSPAITARDLVANALQMRPDRIIVGECRRSEAFDMLQAMNTGHSGSMSYHPCQYSSGRFGPPRNAVYADRIWNPSQCSQSSSSALDLIIQTAALRKKWKKANHRHLRGHRNGGWNNHDARHFCLWNRHKYGRTSTENGTFKVLGMVPTFWKNSREQGIEFPRNYFR